MAPEVVLGEGYTFAVDFWSIAVTTYEFMAGGVPFGENCEDPMDVYMAILNDEINFPHFVKDNTFKNFIKLLLRKNPISRLMNFTQIKSHPWFENFNFVNINF